MLSRRGMVLCLCAAVLLMAGCQQRELPQWAPNVERTDIRPSEWMVGCFAIDPMTDGLRAAGARQQIELTDRLARVAEGRQWYRVELGESHQKYGVWTAVAPSKIRVEVGSNWCGTLIYSLSPTNHGLVGIYQEIGDVGPAPSPGVAVSLRRLPCVSPPAR